MQWDDEADVVCAGGGAVGLARAVSVVDLGGDVFVADHDRCDWPFVDITDADTRAYLGELARDLQPAGHAATTVAVPIRVLREAPPAESRRPVAPFVGDRLRAWNAQCLASPYGYLHTWVSDARPTNLSTADGDIVSVCEIGSIDPDPRNVFDSLLAWLHAAASERGIEPSLHTSLQRLVFEDDEVVGAVFANPAGTVAVRARHGVTIATGSPHHESALPHGDAGLRVCLVSQRASRFGRIELVSRQHGVPGSPPSCRSVNRRLPADLHDAHSHAQPVRCGGRRV